MIVKEIHTYLCYLIKKIITFNVIHGVSKLEKTKFSAEFGKQEVTHLLKVYAVNNQIMVKINW